MSDLLLVFDVGTTGARSVLFNTEGKEVHKSYEEYPLERQPPGISEQNPIIWWNGIKNTCKEVLKKINPDDIIGICAAFHRATTTIIDKDYQILHPALTWMDEREVTDLTAFRGEAGLRRSLPKILWIKNNRPELFNKAWKIISPDSFLYYKLCNEIATDVSNAIYYILNMETLKWDEQLAETFDLPMDLWPQLKKPGEIIGDLTSEAANALGLKKGIPIVVGGGDQQCAALGLGVIDTGQVKATTGTGTFVDMVVDQPIPPMGDIPIFSIPHVVKGKERWAWVLEGAMPGCGTALQWFRDNFSQLQTKQSEEKQIDVYELLSQEAAEVPPGSEGLLIIPLYIFKKGTIHGLGFGHTRGYFIRAIMESAALSANMYLGLLEGMSRIKTEELRVDGGGMNSNLWTQIFADVIRKPIHVSENKDGAALGAAILGFCALKSYSNHETAIKKMVRFVNTKHPIDVNSKIYKKIIRVFMPNLLEILNKKRITGNL